MFFDDLKPDPGQSHSGPQPHGDKHSVHIFQNATIATEGRKAIFCDPNIKALFHKADRFSGY